MVSIHNINHRMYIQLISVSKHNPVSSFTLSSMISLSNDQCWYWQCLMTAETLNTCSWPSFFWRLCSLRTTLIMCCLSTEKRKGERRAYVLDIRQLFFLVYTTFIFKCKGQLHGSGPWCGCQTHNTVVTYGLQQWAALNTHCGWMRVPPQKW